MSSVNKSIHRTIHNLRPINRDTARALSGADKDYESKPKAIEMPKASLPSNWKGKLRCPICGCDVLSKNMKKHVTRHNELSLAVRESKVDN